AVVEAQQHAPAPDPGVHPDADGDRDRDVRDWHRSTLGRAGGGGARLARKAAHEGAAHVVGRAPARARSRGAVDRGAARSDRWPPAPTDPPGTQGPPAAERAARLTFSWGEKIVL